MKSCYLDAMSLVQHFGKPTLFITVTCNSDWEEIKAELLPGQKSQDQPDIVTRVFHSKLRKISDEIYKDGIFGKTVAWVHVIEFQKQGLPHAHILVILHDSHRPKKIENYDSIVCAKIPNQQTNPILFRAVSRHMIHGPCGA